MKLQRILLAVMVVVIAISTWAFYATPSPIFYDASKVVPDSIRVEWARPVGKYMRPDVIGVTDLLDREAVVEILSRYTRGRDDQEDVIGYTPTDNMLLLTMHVEGDGGIAIILGADDGTFHMVTLNGCAYQINNAAALHAELLSLLPE